MASSTTTRSVEVSLQREKLIETAREKLLTAIDDARQKFNSKRQHRRISNSITIPPTHQYKISNEDTSLLWGEEKVTDIGTTLQSWPDRNLLSCCQDLDNQILIVSVVPKTSPDTTEASTTPIATTEKDGSFRNLPAPDPKEKYNLAHEQIRKRLLQEISTKIGRPIEPTSANRGSGEISRINPLRSDPFPPNLYVWDFSPEYTSFPDAGVSRWSLPQIDECNSALNQGYLKVKLVEVEPQGLHHEERAPIFETPEPRNRTARQKRADDTRRLLHDTIVTRLGREIQRRTSSNNHINPTKDDVDPPNGYRWIFSPDRYPSFPDNNNKRLKDWTIDEHEACHTAIQNGWLRVEILNQGNTKHNSPYQSNPNDHAASSNYQSQVAVKPRQASSTASSRPELPPAPRAEPLPSDPKELSFDEQLNSILAEPLALLKIALSKAFNVHVESMGEEIKKQADQILQLKSQVTALQQGELEDRDRIAQAREEGRQEGQEIAMRLMRETDEARQQTELRTHFRQIERAREEGRREGLRQAREEGSMDRAENGGLEKEARNSDTITRNGTPEAAATAEVSNSGASYASAAEALNTGSSFEEPSDASAKESSHDSLRRSARPSRPSSVRGFQAINQEPNLTPITNGTKRTRTSDLNGITNDAMAFPQKSAAAKTENGEEDIYGATPPAKRPRTVLSAVSSAHQKHINEQWKRVAGQTDREWPY